MDNKTPVFTFLNHTADLSIMVRGDSLAALFENTGNALLSLMYKNKPYSQSDLLEISVSGVDYEDLMVRWLSEILYLFYGENIVINRIQINILKEEILIATLEISAFNPDVHETLREIKAVTYHGITVIKKKGFYEAVVTFDI